MVGAAGEEVIEPEQLRTILQPCPSPDMTCWRRNKRAATLEQRPVVDQAGGGLGLSPGAILTRDGVQPPDRRDIVHPCSSMEKTTMAQQMTIILPR
jgi:hypothetical protein